jgi:hypothetical protein
MGDAEEGACEQDRDEKEKKQKLWKNLERSHLGSGSSRCKGLEVVEPSLCGHCRLRIPMRGKSPS